ncbi:MAG: PAS domain S-box protein [Phycisphaerales bacterium]
MSAAQRPVPESEALSRLELLTTSEREVLRLLGEGLAAQEIADRVVRGKCTIETHIRNIGRKIGWRGQQRLTRLAMLAASRGDSEGAGRRDPEVVQALRETIAAHARSRGALEQVMSATADVTGEAFLEALAVSLGRALGVRLVAIVETMPTAPSTPTADTAEMLRSVAWSLDGELFPRVELRLFDSALAGLGPRDERFIADDASTVLRHDPLVQRVGARSVLAMPLRDGDGGLLGGVILMHDEAIDSSRSPEFIVRLFGGRAASELERRATDHRLRESELRYRMLAENSGDVIGRFSATGTRLYASPSSEAVFGWRPEELVGHSGYELIHTEDIERVGKTHRESLANPGVPQRVRWRARRRDGTLLWVESVVRAP